jgi:hypothetical protein
MAGVTSVTFTYPLDIVRTRLSIQSASFAELGAKPQRLPGMWETMATMYKTEGGITALYRGILPTVAGVAPYVCRGKRGRGLKTLNELGSFFKDYIKANWECVFYRLA